MDSKQQLQDLINITNKLKQQLSDNAKKNASSIKQSEQDKFIDFFNDMINNKK